VYLVGLYI
jgi:hypothetical protein